MSLAGNSQNQQDKTNHSDYRSYTKSKIILNSIYQKSYDACYFIGAKCIRHSKTLVRDVVKTAVPVKHFLSDKIYKRFIENQLKKLINELRQVKAGLSKGVSYIKEQRKISFAKTMSAVLTVLKKAVKSHTKLIKSVFNIALPIAATIMLFSVISYWRNLNYGFKVTYNDSFVGYIGDEAQFDQASNMVMGRIVNTNSGFKVDRNPQYSLTIISSDDITDNATLCDNIIKSSSDKIVEATGLYIDGNFYGSTNDKSQVVDTLNAKLDTYKTDEPDVTVEFAKDVKLVDGVYPTDTLTSGDEMCQKMNSNVEGKKTYTVKKGDTFYDIARTNGISLASLTDMNSSYGEKIREGDEIVVSAEVPLIEVKLVKKITYTQTIPYTTETISDSSQFQGYSSVKRSGSNGEQTIVANVTYINGQETDREVISTEVTKEAVTKQVISGTKKATSASTGTGYFIRPVSGGTLTSPFGDGRNHKGIDLAAPKGTAIYAAAGGVVEMASWYSGYGNCVIIRHYNGMKTLYGHASALYVRVGQTVNQGDRIAAVGNTGNSYGNHLHFEIRVGGVPQNPEKYLKVR